MHHTNRQTEHEMTATTRVDLHCHSVYSDGSLSPRDIAELLAADGVVVAALADHDTVDGLPEFSKALARREVVSISGVEITTQCRGEEAHLLAYGFDPTNPELLAALHSMRQIQAPGVQSVAGTIRRKGSHGSHEAGPHTPAASGQIDIADAISLVHRAGGCAFLAHPLLLQPDHQELEKLLADLKEQGLDGIEAIYEPFTEEQRSQLRDMARRLGMLVSAGTDRHDRKPLNNGSQGIDMPTDLWKEFRDAVCSGSSPVPGAASSPEPARLERRFKWRDFVFHFIFPTLLAVVLFVTAIYAVFLPTFERSLLERKREMIRELTNSAWSILVSFERDEKAGKLTRAQAQAMAISRIESLRYGHEGKDYFWLQDKTPRIIMHPYRKDLNGQDVSGFKDPRGVAIFVEFADLVKRGKEGYVEYVWQWKDDPTRLVPKESYIKGFQPWGWIIGTGIYIEDVTQEIKRIERSLVRTSLGISLIVILLLLYVMREGLRSERERAEAEEGLQESTERYRSLVEATTEGTLLVMDGRCRYANPIFLEMIGSTGQELELLDLADLFPRAKDNEKAWERLNALLNGDETTEGFDAVMKRRDGKLIECVISPSRISFAERGGFILLTKSVRPSPESGGTRDTRDQRWRHLQQVVDGISVGLFRARATARGTIVEYSQTAARLLSAYPTDSDTPMALADVFRDPAVYDEFLAELGRDGKAQRSVHLTSADPSTRTIRIAALLVKDEHGAPKYIDGVVEDITSLDKRTTELESAIEKLQTSLLFLHESVSHVGRSAVFCNLDTPIHAAANMMTDNHSSAVLVQSENGLAVGIVTDGDFRQRVVASDLDRREAVFRIMSSPLVTISERAQVYEALLLMEQKGVGHLAVVDESGRIVGVIRNQELLQFRSYGSIVLTREVEQAATPEEVVTCCRRVPDLAKSLLDSGARPHLVTQMISSVCDAATVRLIALAQEELGPAPVRFAFLLLGSQGRQEMTLASDQDNALIFDTPADSAELPSVEKYFGDLGFYVSEWLDRAGYPLCNGEVMARNPKWRQPLPIWKRYFSGWIDIAEPQELLEFTIFFDFRPVYGDSELCNELRRHVFEALRAKPSFFPHFAQNSLLFKPPLRLFGRVLSGGAGGDHQGLLDLKDALMPIVNFARLYAIRQGLEETHTLDRLKALVEADVLPESSCQEISEAYEFLMRLRLQRQAEALSSGQTPDNAFNYRRLGQLEQTLLNQSFAQIAAVQKRISYDFLGGTA